MIDHLYRAWYGRGSIDNHAHWLFSADWTNISLDILHCWYTILKSDVRPVSALFFTIHLICWFSDLVSLVVTMLEKAEIARMAISFLDFMCRIFLISQPN